jgi:hypothetical protein
MDIVSLFTEGKETICIVTVNEEPVDFAIEPEEPEKQNRYIAGNIIVPYTKQYLSSGQETTVTVKLENGEAGDEAHFRFSTEPGKNIIEAETVNNTALIKAVGEGEQYIVISHPKAAEKKRIVFDVLAPSPPLPPSIDVSESPMILRKGETKPLLLYLLNGNDADRKHFNFQVIENAYAMNVQQYGTTLNVTGVAPGAGKIRITNLAAARNYDVMVIVD